MLALLWDWKRRRRPPARRKEPTVTTLGKKIHLKLSEELHAELRALAGKTGIPQSNLLRIALKRFLDNPTFPTETDDAGAEG